MSSLHSANGTWEGCHLQVTENAALVQYVRARCGEPWQSGISKQGSSGTSSGLDGSGGHGMMDQQAVKMYYSRHFPTNLDSPWPSSHPWEQEDPMLESQLMRSKLSDLLLQPCLQHVYFIQKQNIQEISLKLYMCSTLMPIIHLLSSYQTWTKN
jgi:hypothetical protein